MSGGIPEAFEERFWTRHSNPKSGWSRVPLGAVIVYAVYHRNWRVLGAALVWTVVNPFVFSPPETDEAWMTRGVLAEQWWIREQGTKLLDSTTQISVTHLVLLGFSMHSTRHGDNHRRGRRLVS